MNGIDCDEELFMYIMLCRMCRQSRSILGFWGFFWGGGVGDLEEVALYLFYLIPTLNLF